VFEKVREGMDIYISDVNEARSAISKIKKIANIEIKASTKYAGLRKGRVRTLFVYCLRFR
jgi:NMD protein affecting ribosome stability and mRNA decay